jgi:hypothetical protein
MTLRSSTGVSQFQANFGKLASADTPFFKLRRARVMQIIRRTLSQGDKNAAQISRPNDVEIREDVKRRYYFVPRQEVSDIVCGMTEEHKAGSVSNNIERLLRPAGKAFIFQTLRFRAKINRVNLHTLGTSRS